MVRYLVYMVRYTGIYLCCINLYKRVEAVYTETHASWPGLMSESRVRGSLTGSALDAFVAAAAEGDLVDVEQARGMGVALDQRSTLEGRTALQAAAENGQSAVVDYLLRARCDPSQQDANFWTPLHHASSRGHYATCEILLRHGAAASARAPFTLQHPGPVPCATRYSRFFLAVLCGPTPRSCCPDRRIRWLLLKYEWLQMLRPWPPTPRPLSNWREELRCSADATDCDCLRTFIPGWIRTHFNDPRRRSGYKKQIGLGFGGLSEVATPMERGGGSTAAVVDGHSSAAQLAPPSSVSSEPPRGVEREDQRTQTASETAPLPTQPRSSYGQATGT